METLLGRIVKENDIKNIKPEDYRRLAKEIRVKLVKNISRTGGHLASNLGAVELTMALHLCLNFPEDKLIWDVGHQSYVHKLLTGRADAFVSLRQLGGLSGRNCDLSHSHTFQSVCQDSGKPPPAFGEYQNSAA